MELVPFLLRTVSKTQSTKSGHQPLQQSPSGAKGLLTQSSLTHYSDGDPRPTWQHGDPEVMWQGSASQIRPGTTGRPQHLARVVPAPHLGPLPSSPWQADHPHSGVIPLPRVSHLPQCPVTAGSGSSEDWRAGPRGPQVCRGPRPVGQAHLHKHFAALGRQARAGGRAVH